MKTQCPSCTSQIANLKRQLRQKEQQLHQQEMKAIESSFSEENQHPRSTHFFSQRVARLKRPQILRPSQTRVCQCNSVCYGADSSGYRPHSNQRLTNTPLRPSGFNSIRKELRWDDSGLKNKENRAPSRSMLQPRVCQQLRLSTTGIGKTEPREFKNSLDEVLRSQSIQSSEHESERIREAFRKELFEANQRSLLGNGLWASRGSYGSGIKSEGSDLINISSPE